MEDKIMKKLIMLVMLLAFTVPALAEDVSPPVWAGVDGSCTVLWDFTAEDPLPTCYAYTPQLTDPVFYRDSYGGDWDAENGILTLTGEMRLYVPSPDSDGGSTTFNIQVTFDPAGEYWDTYAELWTAPEEEGGEYWGGDEAIVPEFFDLPDGRTVGVWATTVNDVADFPAALIGGMDCEVYEVIIDVLVHDGDPPTSGPGTRCGDPTGPLARNPVPANKEPYAPLDTDLSWDPPEEEIIGITYDVYFGTEPNELNINWYGNNQIADGITETTVANSVFGPLDYATPYYWRVDTIDPNEGVPQTYTGNEWTFTTAPPWVVITGQPQDTVVPEGGTAELTVVAVNDETYQWYKVDTLDPNIVGTQVSGATSATLTIDPVALTDEGYYYCEVMNATLPDATSERARLLTERLMAYWKLDRDLNDEIGTNHGTSPAKITYSNSGIDGNAAEIADPDRYIVIDHDIGTFPGITVSAWFNPTEIEGWHIIMDAIPTGPSNIAIFQEDDLLMGEVFEGGWVEGTGVVAGAWQHAALVYNSADEVIQLYLNGDMIAEDFAEPDAWAQAGPLTMGAYFPADEPDPVAGDYFVGMLDDVRIYNYALSCVQVASMYVDFVPTAEVCCVDYATDLSGPEGQPDCIVNIYDLVEFAKTHWLTCNIVPDCAFELP
jgi:hypothetical protein